jgi:hypothetical protein
MSASPAPVVFTAPVASSITPAPDFCRGCGLRKTRRMINALSGQIHTYKKWDRRAPALKVDPAPYPSWEANLLSLRASVLSMILAHTRGNLHCRVMWGKDMARRVEFSALKDQSKFVRECLTKSSWRPLFSKEETAQLLALLDDE